LNRKHKFPASWLLLAWLPACATAADCGSLATARWILGDWVADGAKSEFHESWVELSPQTFEGIGSERSKSDGSAQASEALRLVEKAGAVFYVAKVAHNELPVAFRLTECSADRMVFENPAHDFPRRLEYRQQPDGGMTVAVSDGAAKGFTLEFKRAAAAASGASASVLAAEDARFAAMVQADAEALGAWLAPDLQYVHSTAQVETREQFLSSIASGQLRYLKITPSERQVVMLDDQSAIVRGRGHFQVAAGDTQLDLQIRYLSVYTRIGGRWQMRAWQSLRLPQDPG
jgi:hypothetical protein